jgi:hypothetical protein
MPWPFGSAPAPTFDSTPSDVPTTSTAVPNTGTGAMWVMGLDFTNPTSNPITITVLDANDKAVIPGVTVYPNQPFAGERPFKPVTGPLTWQASAAGLVGHLWGYK